METNPIFWIILILIVCVLFAGHEWIKKRKAKKHPQNTESTDPGGDKPKAKASIFEKIIVALLILMLVYFALPWTLMILYGIVELITR